MLAKNTIIYGLLMLQCKPYTEVTCQYIHPDRKAGLCTPLKVATDKLLYTEQLQLPIWNGKYFLESNQNFNKELYCSRDKATALCNKILTLNILMKVLCCL